MLLILLRVSAVTVQSESDRIRVAQNSPMDLFSRVWVLGGYIAHVNSFLITRCYVISGPLIKSLIPAKPVQCHATALVNLYVCLLGWNYKHDVCESIKRRISESTVYLLHDALKFIGRPCWQALFLSSAGNTNNHNYQNQLGMAGGLEILLTWLGPD